MPEGVEVVLILGINESMTASRRGTRVQICIAIDSGVMVMNHNGLLHAKVHASKFA